MMNYKPILLNVSLIFFPTFFGQKIALPAISVTPQIHLLRPTRQLASDSMAGSWQWP
jgi:hypothetical protein